MSMRIPRVNTPFFKTCTPSFRGTLVGHFQLGKAVIHLSLVEHMTQGVQMGVGPAVIAHTEGV